jgi:hypothetical protein
MKLKKRTKIGIVSCAIASMIFVSCTNDAESKFKEVMDSAKADDNGPGELLHQISFEITTSGDTINKKDQYGLKQGIWITNTGVLLANGGIKKDTAYYKDDQALKK